MTSDIDRSKREKHWIREGGECGKTVSAGLEKNEGSEDRGS